MASKIIAITGASDRIGRALALRLAGDGASLGLCARRQERLD
jgi:short-subunit dehydrogenase